MQRSKLTISLKKKKSRLAQDKGLSLILLIDHFDSFTYNLVQAFQMLGQEVKVIEGGALGLKECLSLNPSYLVIGPGPGSPSNYPLTLEIIRECPNIPLLGICLGHQALAEAYGGTIKRAAFPMHGKVSPVFHDESPLFASVPQGFLATRYHSLVVEEASLPTVLKPAAWTAQGEIMALKHTTKPQFSFQFHPEAIMTSSGQTLLSNFLDTSF